MQASCMTCSTATCCRLLWEASQTGDCVVLAQTWCEERQSMLCEICGKPYAPPLTAQLTAALERGAQRHQRYHPALTCAASPEP